MKRKNLKKTKKNNNSNLMLFQKATKKLKVTSKVYI